MVWTGSAGCVLPTPVPSVSKAHAVWRRTEAWWGAYQTIFGTHKSLILNLWIWTSAAPCQTSRPTPCSSSCSLTVPSANLGARIWFILKPLSSWSTDICHCQAVHSNKQNADVCFCTFSGIDTYTFFVYRLHLNFPNSKPHFLSFSANT